MAKFKVRYWETVDNEYEQEIDVPHINTVEEAEEWLEDNYCCLASDFPPPKLIQEQISDYNRGGATKID